jgi:AAA15 family ATPase/GTPase
LEHIQNIEIKNFKSIRHAVIDGCKRVNVFIGAPNVGKSNILEALSTFSVSEKTNLISDFIRLKEPTTLFFNGEIDKKAEVILDDIVRIRASNDKDGITFLFEHDWKSYGFDTIDNKKFGINILGNTPEAYEIGRYVVFQDPKRPNGLFVSGIGSYNRKLIEIDRRVTIRKYEFKRDSSSSTTTNNWEFEHPFGENIFNILATNSKLRNAIQEIFQPYNLELLNDKRMQAFTILKRTGDSIFSIPYELVADTIQRLIFYKAAIASNKETVLLFEEPEAHMYPPYIAKFTSDMMYDENNNQYFITTHSPFVVNDIMENLKKDDYAIYTVGYDKEHGETLVKRLSEAELHEIYQYGIDLFLNLENYLPHEHKQ